jgi:hypothetical protein
MGHLWLKVCDLLNINHRLFTAFQFETDGATERMNQKLEHYLRCFVIYAQNNWPILFSLAMLVINAKIAKSIIISL